MTAVRISRDSDGKFPLGKALLILVIGALTGALVGIGFQVADGASLIEAVTSGAPWIQAGGWVVGAGLFVVVAMVLTRTTNS